MRLYCNFYYEVVRNKWFNGCVSQVPEEIMGNINNQVRRLREVPKRLDQYTQEEIDNFPKVFDWPKQYVIDPDIVRKNSVTKQM